MRAGRGIQNAVLGKQPRDIHVQLSRKMMREHSAADPLRQLRSRAFPDWRLGIYQSRYCVERRIGRVAPQLRFDLGEVPSAVLLFEEELKSRY